MGEEEQSEVSTRRKITIDYRVVSALLVGVLIGCGAGVCLTSGIGGVTVAGMNFIPQQVREVVVTATTTTVVEEDVSPPMVEITTENQMPKEEPTETLEVFPTPTFAALSMARDAQCIPLNAGSERALVTQVLDGDTVQVEINGQPFTVRYIGIVAQEAAEAVSRNRQLVEGKEVVLVKGVAGKDAEGNLLRYMLADGVFVNQKLVEEGYAQAMSTFPEVSCDGLFISLQQTAQSEQRGLWASGMAASSQTTPMSSQTPTPTLLPGVTPTATTLSNLTPTSTITSVEGLQIANVLYQGSGAGEPNEYVEIVNNSNLPITIGGWSIYEDNNGTEFFFPAGFILQPGMRCKVYTNQTPADSCGLSFASSTAVWDNVSDCASLYNEAEDFITEFCWP